jgi:hypothetical protein
MFSPWGVERGPPVQQNLYLTPLGTLLCEHCGAAAAGTGTEDNPYVITHTEDCDFVRKVASRCPGRHRARPSR